VVVRFPKMGLCRQLSDISGRDAPLDVSLSDSGLNSTLDKNVDVLVYRGTEGHISRLVDLFSQIDVSPKQVQVQGALFEVQTNERDISAVGVVVNLFSGLGLKITNPSFDSGNAVSVLAKGVGFDFTGLFQALSSDDRFKLVSSPSLRVVSGGTAKFSVGQEVPILGSVSYDNQGKAVQSITYKESGVIFTVSADVHAVQSDLTVGQQLSEFQTTTTGLAQTPTLVKREVSTKISVTDDDVVVIGGLSHDKKTSSFSGLSFLPRFFGSSAKQGEKKELVLVLSAKRL